MAYAIKILERELDYCEPQLVCSKFLNDGHELEWFLKIEDLKRALSMLKD